MSSKISFLASVEVFVLFLLTDSLIIFGVTLPLAQQSHTGFGRIHEWLQQ